MLGACVSKKEKVIFNLTGNWTGTNNIEIVTMRITGGGIIQEIPSEIELDFYRDSTFMGIIKITEDISFSINGTLSTTNYEISFKGNLIVDDSLLISGEIKPNDDGTILLTYTGKKNSGDNTVEHNGEAILSKNKKE